MRLTRTVLALAVSMLVVAGLVPTADAAPLACGSQVRRSKTLTSNLNCTGDGLIIAANGITLNLGGFTITGDGGVGDNGIDNPTGKDNVVIKNGTVQNFDEGVKIGENATATANTVRGITATNNLEEGIDIDTGAGHKIIGNTTSNNSQSGIEVDARATLISGNTSNSNTDDGIDAEGNRNILTGNTTNQNGDEGTDVEGNKNVISGATALSNGEDGFDIEGGRNKLKGSTAQSNVADGVEIAGSLNLVKESNASGNGVNGIEINTDVVPSANNRFFTNQLTNNGNTVSDDVGLGFDGQADTGTVQGSGNTATGNDNPAQCIPDICLP